MPVHIAGMNNLGHLSDLNLKEVAFGNPLQVPQRARDDAFRELNRRELERLDREAANMQVWEEMNEWAESGSSQSECVDCGTEIEYKPESNDRCVRCGGICLSCYTLLHVQN